MKKVIVITGAPCSNIGKGTVASTIGMLFKFYDLKVTMAKIDPYLNYDAGTISPVNEHGEVFVLNDGSETDLDLGSYERMINENLEAKNSITTGKIYKTVIEKERHGDYLGQTVQIVPHITNEIQERIIDILDNNDICIIELGGVVGDIESMPFIEALRQYKTKNKKSFCHIHVSLIPFLGEYKTKPTQNSVKELRKYGLESDIIICRSTSYFEESLKNKIAFTCNVESENVIQCPNNNSLYDVANVLMKQNIITSIQNILNIDLKINESLYDNYLTFNKTYKDLIDSDKSLKIAIVGKYFNPDSYLSIYKALEHCMVKFKVKIEISLHNSEEFEEKSLKEIENWYKYDGIIIPGGFGKKAMEGKIKVIKYARENNIPILGICLGFQLMVIEYCRNVLRIEEATSEEFNKESKDKVIMLVDETNPNLGGTMELGEKEVSLSEDSILHKYYKNSTIKERHRHRYEVNYDYVKNIEEKGLKFTGINKENKRYEILELPNNKYFVGTQFHPEFKSRIFEPSPVFASFIGAITNDLKNL